MHFRFIREVLGLLLLGLVSVAGAETVLHVHSQPGDYVGGGTTQTIRPSDASNVIASTVYDFVQVRFVGANWALYLQAPNGQLPGVGTYENAVAWGYGAESLPQLSFHGPGTTCGDILTGRFQILEFTLAPNSGIASLAVDFEQYCANSIAGLFGQLRYNSAIPIDTTLRWVDPFSFPPVAGATAGTSVASAAATISGVDVPVPVAISGGEYSINSGTFTSAPGTIRNGDTVRVRLTAASAANTLATAWLDLGGWKAPFKVGTATGPNPQPAGAPLIALTGLPASTSGAVVTRIHSPATLVNIDLAKAYSTAVSEVRVRDPREPLIEIWGGAFSGPNRSRLEVGSYPDARSDGSPTYPVLATGVTYDKDGPGCLYGEGVGGRMTVSEAEYLADGTPAKLALDFVQTCARGLAADVIGHVRINSTVPIDYSIRLPVTFSFAPVTGATPGATITSEDVDIRGINVDVPVSIVGGEYSVDNGPFTSVAGIVSPGRRLKVRLIASPQYNALGKATVTVGERAVDFLVGTAMGANPQANGNPFAVLISQGADPIGLGNSHIYSPATMAGFTVSKNPQQGAAITLTSTLPGAPAKWLINFATPVGVPLSAGTYPAVFLAHPNYPVCTTVTGQFTVHEIAYTATGIDSLAIDFVQHCNGSADPLYGYLRFNSNVPVAQIPDSSPAPFTFPSLFWVTTNAWAVSNAITLGGINIPAPVSIAGGEYSIDNGPFTSSPGTISLGQKLKLRLFTPGTFSMAASATVTVGSYSTAFTVTTEPPDSLPNPFFFAAIVKAPLAQWVLSPVTSITGINTVATVTIVGGEFSIGGRPFTDAPSAISPGESVQVRVMSSAIPNDSRTSTLTIGGNTAQFIVWTSKVPPAPVISSVNAGIRQATLSFASPPDSLALPATSYTATCNPGAVTGTGAASPVTVTGLTSGVTFTCSMTATSGIGTSVASPTMTVTPSGTPPALVSAQSRKTHGSQTFDLALNASAGNPTTEPRTGGANGNHTVVFIFDKPVVTGTVAATEGAATAGTPTFNGNEMIVPLGQVRDAQYVGVTVGNVGAADGGSGGGGSVRIGILAGDSNRSRNVTLSDMLSANAVLTQPVSTANFLNDVNASGTLTLSDMLAINANLTRALPAP